VLRNEHGSGTLAVRQFFLILYVPELEATRASACGLRLGLEPQLGAAALGPGRGRGAWTRYRERLYV